MRRGKGVLVAGLLELSPEPVWGGIWDAPAGGVGILVRQGIPARQVALPNGVPRGEADSLTQALWHSTRWCHVQVGLGRESESLEA